jgi:hypothetical protein
VIDPADLAQAVGGFWAVHPSRKTAFGAERYRRRPTCHIAFDGPGWRLYETGRTWRLRHAVGTGQGRWQAVDLDGRTLLVLTVQSYRPSAVSQVALESNYGYSGGATAVISAKAARDDEALKMRNGEARMYFLPVHLRPHEVIVALPSSGGMTPRQRWVRVQGQSTADATTGSVNLIE